MYIVSVGRLFRAVMFAGRHFVWGGIIIALHAYARQV
jgi:hypothetical protein